MSLGTFNKYDPAKNKCITRRHQFSLRLADAMTIHKAQDMSLHLVEDCKHASNLGQIGVAVRVLSYKSSLCWKHSNKVAAFYLKFGGIGDDKDN